MSKRPDSDKTARLKLQERIARLAAAPAERRGRWRVIAQGDDTAMLAAILTELDETVLARRIELRTDTGKSTTLAAANRRLYAIGDGAAGDDGADAGMGGADAGFARIRAQLQDLVDGAGELLVATRRIRRAANAGDVGISAEALARAWHLDIGATAHGALPETLRTFTDLCRQYAVAEIGLNAGRVFRSQGDSGALEVLGAAARTELADLPADAVIPEGCLVLDFDTAPVIAVLSSAGPVAAFVVSPDAVDGLRDAWFATHAPVAAPA